ncbi:MAG TPA: class I SAM-dependent methyltransferase [Candidatus Paceibacterota bacterium]|nr:class I SAM-dependent methyltransferase [Candidatus Paceibacterota bacterium]
MSTFVNPIFAASHFHLHKGDSVADFGAGSGHYMRPLSEAVGSGGTVYLCEIQKPLVEALGNQARDARLKNVKVIWGDIEEPGGTQIPDHSLDAVLLSNVLFQATDKKSLFNESARVLRPGGKLIVIDWASACIGLGPRPEGVVSEYQTKELAEESQFSFERNFHAGEHHYGLVFRKK